MTQITPDQLSDHDLLRETQRTAEHERHTTAQLIALLAELDARRLYLGEGYSSLFTYCTDALQLSEHAAYGRITAARAARRFPLVLELLTAGDIALTTVGLLNPQLTEDNHEPLLRAASHKTKRDVERQVACLDPQPDIRASVRKVASVRQVAVDEALEEPLQVVSELPEPPAPGRTAPPATLAPLAPERYVIKVTVSRETHDRLRRAQDLLRHSIPNGDPAAVIERALVVLVEQLEKTRFAAASRLRVAGKSSSHSRHVPAAVKRAVWTRDSGRCAFVGARGRCTETAFLEFHHVRPYAVGGRTDIQNLELRCSAHNAYEAAQYFGMFDRGVSEADGRWESPVGTVQY